jgi:hypothetical protein
MSPTLRCLMLDGVPPEFITPIVLFATLVLFDLATRRRKRSRR